MSSARPHTTDAPGESLAAFLTEPPTRRWSLYRVTVVLVALGLAALPLIRVPITVETGGVLRPITEIQQVRAPASGLVDRVLVRQNAPVTRGQALMTLQAGSVDARSNEVASRIASVRERLADLEALARLATGEPVGTLRTQEYRRERDVVQSVMERFRVDLERARSEAARTRQLFERELASRQEMEEAEYRTRQVEVDRALALERSLAEWQQTRVQLEASLTGLVADSIGVAEERRAHVVTAPISGTITEMPSLSSGGFVSEGEVIAAISPDEAMVAEAYVPPRDVGLLREGMRVTIAVDAFDQFQWGTVPGAVAEISGDYVMVDGRPMFRVRSSLARNFVALPSGVRGRFRKGMTIQARFVVTEVTLLQRLTTSFGDWLAPESH